MNFTKHIITDYDNRKEKQSVSISINRPTVIVIKINYRYQLLTILFLQSVQ